MNKKQFYARTKPGPGGCLLWLRARTAGGYGELQFRGKIEYAHRVAWMLEKGTIPARKVICHSCDTRACVAIKHLFAATQRENLLDGVRKGRVKGTSSPGSAHHAAKLTEKAVIEIRETYRFRGRKGNDAVQLGRRFGVSKSVIIGVVKRKSWTHI